MECVASGKCNDDHGEPDTNRGGERENAKKDGEHEKAANHLNLKEQEDCKDYLTNEEN